MAEQVQTVLDRMVEPLKDLMDRGIFSESEIHAIVTRRRASEYLLKRRVPRKADFHRYIQAEEALERLRKLRLRKVADERDRDEEERQHKLETLKTRRGKRKANGGEETESEKKEWQTVVASKAAYVGKSGPGDTHVLRHVHFCYDRLVRKFGRADVSLYLRHAAYAKKSKSFIILNRIYAEAVRHHPRVADLWIQAASQEFFGSVADEDGVGGSMRKARVWMQRGLRVNPTSEELWLQFFGLELHYVQKLRGRREILRLGLNKDGVKTEEDGSEDEDDDDDATSPERMHLPCRIIIKNAFESVRNHGVSFRLRFAELCRQFPETEGLETLVMQSVAKDFGKDRQAWVARIARADQQLGSGEEVDDKAEDDGNSDGEGPVGFLASAAAAAGTDKEEEENKRPHKKAKQDGSGDANSSDAALDLLAAALIAVPQARMYVEGARFLRDRIRRILDSRNVSTNVSNEDGEGDDDDGEAVANLVRLHGKGGDDAIAAAANRHVQLLEELYGNAETIGISSNADLALDRAEFYLSAGAPEKAEPILARASKGKGGSNQDGSAVVDARVWLRWADVSAKLHRTATTTTSSLMTMKSILAPEAVLRLGLECTPVHAPKRGHVRLLTGLMHRLMTAAPMPKHMEGDKEDNDGDDGTKQELKKLFQTLLLLSASSSQLTLNHSPSAAAGDDSNNDDDEEEEGINVAGTLVAYLKYVILTGGDIAEIRSTYSSVLFSSTYGTSSSSGFEKTDEEVRSMTMLFDLSIAAEETHFVANVEGGKKMKKKKTERKADRKKRLVPLFERAIVFLEDGGRNDVVERVEDYRKGLDNVLYR